MKVEELTPGTLVARRGYWSMVGEVVEVIRTETGGWKVKVKWRTQFRETEGVAPPSVLVLPSVRSLEIYRANGRRIQWRTNAEKRLDQVFEEVRRLVPFKLDDHQVHGTYEDTLRKARSRVKIELSMAEVKKLKASGDQHGRYQVVTMLKNAPLVKVRGKTAIIINDELRELLRAYPH